MGRESTLTVASWDSRSVLQEAWSGRGSLCLLLGDRTAGVGEGHSRPRVGSWALGGRRTGRQRTGLGRVFRGPQEWVPGLFCPALAWANILGQELVLVDVQGPHMGPIPRPSSSSGEGNPPFSSVKCGLGMEAPWAVLRELWNTARHPPNACWAERRH